MADKPISEAIPLPAPPPPILEEAIPAEAGFDPLGAPSDVLAVDHERQAAMDSSMAQQVADIYNMAGIGLISKPVMVDDVLRDVHGTGPSGQEMSSIMAAIKEENAGIQRDLIISAISDPKITVEQRVELARTVSDIDQYDLNSVMRQAMHNANVIENDAETEEAIADRELGAHQAEEVPTKAKLETPMPASDEEVREYYINTLNEVYGQASEASLLSTDFLATTIPFRYEAPVMEIFHQLGLDKGVINNTGGKVLLGEALRQIRNHVESLDPKGKKEALDIALRVLKPNSGVYGDGNDFVTAHALEQIFYKDLFNTDIDDTTMFPSMVGSLIPHKEGGEAVNKWLREQSTSGMGVMDNFGTILDLVGLGGLAKATIKFGSKWMPKSLTKLKKVAPNMATRTAVDSLDDELIRMKFPAMTKEDVVSTFLPSADKAMQEGGFEGFGELVSRQLDIRDRLLRISSRSNMNAAERADAFDEIQKMYGDVAAKPTSSLHLNESVFTRGPRGVTIEAVFGRTKTKPFSSYAQAAWAARNEIEEVFGPDASVSVVWRNPATNKLEDVPKSMKPFTKGEFFLKAMDERAYESAPTAYHGLVMGDNEVANLRFAPSMWKLLLGPTVIGKEALDRVRIASRQRPEWNKLVSGLTTDLAHLSGKESRMLAKVLKDGEQVSPITGTGKLYGPTELRNMGLGEDGVRAYYSYRTATDIMYEVVNRHTRTRMLREGVMDVRTPKGRVGYAQPRALVDAQGDISPRATKLHAYDPVANEFVQFDRTTLEGVYRNGDVLARLEQPMLGKGGKEATHVVISERAGTRAYPLPRQVVTKVEGYYPHMWNSNYVVYGITRAGNRFALGLANNEKEAKAVADKMNATIARRSDAGKTNKFEKVSYDFDRSLTMDMSRRGSVQEGLYVNMGGPVYGHRNGGSLRNFSKAAGDVMVDPIESMLRGMEIVGNKVTKAELATFMRQKLYNYAKQEGILRDPKIIPHTKEDLVSTAATQMQYNKARAYLDSIDNMLNMRDSVDETVSKFFLGASGVLARMASTTLAGKLATRAAKGGDFMSALMGFMHRTTIASSPTGQGALQASQSLMMLGIAPVQYLKAVRQTVGIATLVGMRASALHGGKMFALSQADFMKEAKAIAFAAGVDEKEIVKLVDTILDSGLVASVGYHTQMRNAIRSAAEERQLARAKGLNRPIGSAAGRFARAVDAQTFGRLSRYGFEAGESVNQIATFLTLYNRDKAKGIANLSDPDYVRGLLGSTAELTGDMIPETSFAYQRGWFKAAMQFVNFQHKMLLLSLPKALGGAKSLTGPEKAGMIFAQFLLFGRRGAPHMDAIYRVVDSKIREQADDEGEANTMYAAWNDPSTRAVMDGLVFDTAGNYVLKSLVDKDSPDFALSQRFAPGGGSEFIMDRMFALASNPTKAIFGLAGEKASKVYSFMKRVGDITMANIGDYDDVPLDERFDELAKEGGVHLFSAYNRYLAAKAAERMDGWVSSGGRVTEGFSGPLEHHLYTQFGILTKDRESLYEAMDKYREETLSNPLARERDLTSVADKYYSDLVMTVVKYNDQAVDDTAFNLMMDRWVKERGLLFSVLPPEDAEFIRDNVQARLERAAMGEGTSAELALVDRLTKQVRSGAFGEDGPDVALYLDEAEFVRNNPKLKEIVRQAWVEATTDDYLEQK